LSVIAAQLLFLVHQLLLYFPVVICPLQRFSCSSPFLGYCFSTVLYSLNVSFLFFQSINDMFQLSFIECRFLRVCSSASVFQLFFVCQLLLLSFRCSLNPVLPVFSVDQLKFSGLSVVHPILFFNCSLLISFLVMLCSKYAVFQLFSADYVLFPAVHYTFHLRKSKSIIKPIHLTK